MLCQGLRRAYFYFISTYGSLSSAFAALCKCDFELSQKKCLPMQLFSELLSEQFPQSAFDAAVHNLVWHSLFSDGVTYPTFVAVMSRAPLWLPYRSCHTMCCILTLCETNDINCSELFLKISACDDGFIRRSEYATCLTCTPLSARHWTVHVQLRVIINL